MGNVVVDMMSNHYASTPSPAMSVSRAPVDPGLEEYIVEKLRYLYGGPRLARNIRDRRVRNLAIVIENSPDDWRAIQSGIKNTGLSCAYLSVRFKEEAHLPMRSYALWRKFERACLLVVQGTSAKDAALIAGFSDQSHMGRAARRFAHKSFGQVQQELARVCEGLLAETCSRPRELGGFRVAS